MTKVAEPIIPALPEDFKNMVDLMAVFSAASHQLAELEAEANGLLLELIDDKRADYARLQKTLTECEAALEIIARSHPEWFTEKKSVATPYGTVKFNKSTKTVIDNEEFTILLIEKHAAENKDFDSSALIIPSKTLNIEAIEKLPPELLAAFRIERPSDDNFKVEAVKVKMGKAVKDAAKKAGKAEKSI
jgi:hypothetical protein